MRLVMAKLDYYHNPRNQPIEAAKYIYPRRKSVCNLLLALAFIQSLPVMVMSIIAGDQKRIPRLETSAWLFFSWCGVSAALLAASGVAIRIKVNSKARWIATIAILSMCLF